MVYILFIPLVQREFKCLKYFQIKGGRAQLYPGKDGFATMATLTLQKKKQLSKTSHIIRQHASKIKELSKNIVTYK